MGVNLLEVTFDHRLGGTRPIRDYFLEGRVVQRLRLPRLLNDHRLGGRPIRGYFLEEGVVQRLGLPRLLNDCPWLRGYVVGS